MKKPKKRPVKKNKRKIKEIKSSKEIKEIKSGEDESQLEEEIKDVGFTPDISILENTKTAPVLEKIAQAEGEVSGRTVFTQRNQPNNEESIDYKEEKSDYAPKEAHERRVETGYNEPTPGYISQFQEEKESKETKRLMQDTGERITPRGARHSWESLERRPTLEANEETLKYTSKGDTH